MVRDRIWAPESLTRSFFNNLHLGHRAVGMMKRLSLRSVYWSGIAKDLEDFYNECYDCNQKLQKNKAPEPLPEEETTTTTTTTTTIQKYKNTKIQKYKNTKIQKYKNTKIQ